VLLSDDWRKNTSANTNQVRLLLCLRETINVPNIDICISLEGQYGFGSGLGFGLRLERGSSESNFFFPFNKALPPLVKASYKTANYF